MNMQAMMKQAQKLQKEMMAAKEEIDNKTYVGKSSFVSITMSGDKKVKEIKIDKESIETDEMEMLQDMITVALENVMQQIDKETDEKMGKYTKGLPGF